MELSMNLKPRISEKAYAQSQSLNVYVFIVPKASNKTTIAKAVTKQFDVTVKEVNISHLPSKAKRTVRKGGRKVERGTQSGIKKAYVTLKEGDSIAVFAADDQEDNKPAETKKGKK
jgi:ribosomal protein L23